MEPNLGSLGRQFGQFIRHGAVVRVLPKNLEVAGRTNIAETSASGRARGPTRLARLPNGPLPRFRLAPKPFRSSQLVGFTPGEAPCRQRSTQRWRVQIVASPIAGVHVVLSSGHGVNDRRNTEKRGRHTQSRTTTVSKEADLLRSPPPATCLGDAAEQSRGGTS